ncbi:helix-turn-helix domain-containing protein [Amycolatopsis nalaikhensis]|uniref:Helix-turn-helix domain-containing protein n=1 Tax=Amycolatopsis nalaikhensis TaxID=715472 RepID=A0ABY8XEX5_9PSEU|nr:helix-turn-helix domain-containing protein [Amycolatopsis sp. 2-2]WIV54152.1 helix-turn-helix domain-containing protein [Amycolatopsis sp. 2-2]
MAGRGVLEGAFALLETLDELGGRAGFAELARAGDLPKTTTHRLLDQLIEVGAVERVSGGYRIGTRLFRLGRNWEPELRAAAREWLPVLSARIRAGTLLAVRRGDRVVVVAAEGVDARPGTALSPDAVAARVLAAPGRGCTTAGPDGAAAGPGLRGYAAAADGVAVPVRGPGGAVVAALAAAAPPGRNPLALVPGLASTARVLGTALTG